MKNPLIRLVDIQKSFKKYNQPDLQVLGHVNFELYEGEIVALLGQSGSGKSTLLRIIAGLSQPTSGEIFFQDRPVIEPIPAIHLFSQQVALLPWLTVLENVELGLEAQGIERKERRRRALQALDTIGLDGFESAYPRELSSGMQSRVGFARAWVLKPDILLMDEPFATLDVLTAENLRSDLLDLWQEDQTSLKSILLVTHDIVEAALMADRIVVFASDPGHIRGELLVPLSFPRNPQDPQVSAIVDHIYAMMTSDPKGVHKRNVAAAYRHKSITIGYRLPAVEVSSLLGLVEGMAYSDKKPPFELQDLAESLDLDINELFPMIDLLDILQIARIFEGSIELTAEGKKLGTSDILEKKEIFAKHLLHFIPLVHTIRSTLDETASHSVPEEYFIALLQAYLTPEESKRVLMNVIEWGRYAEIFAYHAGSRMLSLENP